jgi:hypothetical protein
MAAEVASPLGGQKSHKKAVPVFADCDLYAGIGGDSQQALTDGESLLRRIQPHLEYHVGSGELAD